MIKIGLIDDGAGICAATAKIMRCLSADCVAMIADTPFSGLSLSELASLAVTSAEKLQAVGCDAVVICSQAMTYAAKRRTFPLPTYFCETPVLHSATYTASNVVVFGDRYSFRQVKIPNAIVIDAEKFSEIALTCSDKQIADYIEKTLAPYEGQFDCIALSDGLMSLKAECFNMAFPSVRVFDSVDGVVRKLKKAFNKQVKRQRAKGGYEPSVKFVNGSCEEIVANYSEFFE